MTAARACFQESLLLSTYSIYSPLRMRGNSGKLCPDEICGMLLRNGVPQESLCYQNYESILAGRGDGPLRDIRRESHPVSQADGPCETGDDLQGYDMVPMGFLPPGHSLPYPESMGNMPQLSEKIGKTKKARSGEKPAKGAGKSKKRPQIG